MNLTYICANCLCKVIQKGKEIMILSGGFDMMQFEFLAERNRMAAFEHLAEIKKQDKNTVAVDGNIYSYKTKRGLVKKYISFKSWNEYKESGLWLNSKYKLERVNGFIFVKIPEEMEPPIEC